MADTYWRRIRTGSISEVTSMIEKVKSLDAKSYWTEVLAHLNLKTKGKK
jgi:hypothetical protein